MITVIGIFEDEGTIRTAKFDRADICEFVDNIFLADDQIQTIANILAANIEWLFETNVDLTYDGIEDSYFNDAYWDMQEDLQERFGLL